MEIIYFPVFEDSLNFDYGRNNGKSRFSYVLFALKWGLYVNC